MPDNKTTEAITARVSRLGWADKMVGALNPCDGLCSLCGGSGHLLCYQDGTREFWPCPACAGTGCRSMFGRPLQNAKTAGFVRHAG